MVRTIHQNSKDCLGSFGLIGNYTDVSGVQVTGDEARRQARALEDGVDEPVGDRRDPCDVH